MSETEIEHADRLRRLVEAGISISAQLSLEELLEKIVATAVELTDATYGALGVLVAGGKTLETFVTVGVDDARRQEIGPLPTGRGVLGALITEAKPVRLADLTEDPRSVGFPPGHPMMRSFLGVPILLRGSPFGNLYLTEKRGAPGFSEEDQGVAELFAAQAAIAVENARLYGAVRKWNEQLESLIAGSNRLAREIDPAYVRQSAVDQVRDLLDCDASLLLLRGSERAMHVDAVAGRVPESVIGEAVDPWGSKWARVLARGHAERVEFALDDPEFDSDPIARAIEARAVAMLPLVVAGRELGLLAACNPRGESPVFTDADLRVGELFADRAALALDLSQRVEQDGLRRALLAQEDERRRLARELHDETGQALTSIVLGIGSVKAGDTTDACHEAADHLNELAVDALENVRRLAFDLRPKALDDFGLEPALARLVERLNELGTVRVDLEAQLTKRMPPDVESALYRTVQEALTNVMKHAGATRASVQVSRRGDEVVAIVEDDGVGFEGGVASANGFGLVAMRERLTLLDGDLEVETAKDHGTTVRASVPLATPS